MRILAWFCLSALLLSCAPPIEPGSGSNPAPTPEAKSGPAGIFLYARHQDEILVLVANDRLGTRGWSGFGGGAKEGEGRALTAAREASEETRGYFDQDWLLNQILGQRPTELGGFSLYFAEVPYVPAQQVKNHPLKRLRPAYMEMHHYTWIPFGEIEPLLGKASLNEADLKVNPDYIPEGCREDAYWDVWINTLRQVQLKNGFPWSR